MKNLISALLKAQGEFPAIHKNSTNPHFKSTYADLGEVLEKVNPVLRHNGLVLIQTFGTLDGKPSLKTTLAHESGETISGEQQLVMAREDAQGLAGASTYARRYGVLAILSLAAEDDDGQAASKPAPKKDEKPQSEKVSPAIIKANEVYSQVVAHRKCNHKVEQWMVGVRAGKLTDAEIEYGIIGMQKLLEKKS
jgi:hypothetical protein